MSTKIPERTYTGQDELVLSDNDRETGRDLADRISEEVLAPRRLATFKRAQAYYNAIASDNTDPRFATLPAYQQIYNSDFVDWYLGQSDRKDAQTRHVEERTPELEAIIERADRRIPAIESNIEGITARIGSTNEQEDDAEALTALNADLVEAQKDKADAEAELATFT